jgi:hypothetical protein
MDGGASQSDASQNKYKEKSDASSIDIENV